MEKIVLPGMICVQKSQYTGDVSYSFLAGESNYMADHGYMEVCKHTIEFEVPEDFNIVAAQVAGLNAAKETLQREFNARVRELNNQIANLLCLEFNPTEPVETAVATYDLEIPF